MKTDLKREVLMQADQQLSYVFELEGPGPPGSGGWGLSHWNRRVTLCRLTASTGSSCPGPPSLSPHATRLTTPCSSPLSLCRGTGPPCPQLRPVPGTGRDALPCADRTPTSSGARDIMTRRASPWSGVGLLTRLGHGPGFTLEELTGVRRLPDPGQVDGGDFELIE